MTDYSKWKVNDLKAELKRRGIAQTGLRLKQQFIDKLEEIDAGGAVEAGEQAAGEETQEQESVEPETQEQPEQQPEEPEQPEQPKQPEEQQQPERDEQPTDAPQELKPDEQATAQEQEAGAQNGEIESRNEKPTDDTPRDEPVTQEEQPETKADQEQPKETTQEQEQPKESEPPTNEPKTSDEVPSASEIEDQRKRKRRSQSPLLSAEAVANKKAKAQDESPRVLLPEDREGLSTEEQLAANDAAPPAPKGEAEEEARPRKDAPPKQDARFKGLFAGTERELARPVSPPPDVEMKDAEVEPALHAATAALYIGGLMRPLQPMALRNHLISLASAPGTSPNADSIVDFHLDSIKTHCFARFSSVSAASRVRAALHATVWPNERNRKALFADFIPESKVQPWIDLEEDSRNRSGPAPRWEVRYNRTDDDTIEATLDEVDPRSATAHHQPSSRSRQDSFQQDGFRAPPSGPRADRDRPPPAAPAPAESRPSRPGQGFKPLDELFKSTTAKPKLYYLPVSREMADRRLDRFDDLLQKGSFPRRGGDETRRITFEDGDYFVDNGPEFAGGPGGAGRGRRRGRGRGRGGFGGFGGDSWRG